MPSRAAKRILDPQLPIGFLPLTVPAARQALAPLGHESMAHLFDSGRVRMLALVVDLMAGNLSPNAIYPSCLQPDRG